MSRKSKENSLKTDMEMEVKKENIEIEDIPAFSTTEVVEEKVIKKEKYKVIFINKYSIVVEDKDGNGITKYGSFNVKIGDTIEF